MWSISDMNPLVFAARVLSLTLEGLSHFLPDGRVALNATLTEFTKQGSDGEVTLTVPALKKMLQMVSKGQCQEGASIASIVALKDEIGDGTSMVHLH